MRVIKGVVLFCFSMIAVSGCFDPPEFSDIPKLTFKDIRFKEVGEAADYDTLILYLDFQDGNGDVGLSSVDPDDFDAPYNVDFFYLTEGTNDTLKIPSIIWGDYTVVNPGSIPGKIVTNETRLTAGYGYLPLYNPNSCINYSPQKVLVPFSSVDPTYDIKDTVTINFQDLGSRDFAEVEAAFLYKPNPNHFNIEVTFEQLGPSGFVEFDWFKEYCITYDGRFSTSLKALPTYAERPIEGSIRYAMPNSSFFAIFGNKTLKITARIRDRALHISNAAVSREFELNEIQD